MKKLLLVTFAILLTVITSYGQGNAYRYGFPKYASGVNDSSLIAIAITTPTGHDTTVVMRYDTLKAILSRSIGGGYWTASGSDIYNNNAGNVGIGTSAPMSLFDIETSDASKYFQYNSNDGAGATMQFNIGGTYLTSTVSNSGGTISHFYQGDANKWNTNDNIYFQYSGEDGSGNVGIGTNSPAYKLDVLGSTHISDTLLVDGTAIIRTILIGTSTDSVVTDSAGYIRHIAQSSGGSGWSLTGNSGTNPVTNFIGTTDNASFAIRTNDSTRVLVDSLGNVIIDSTAFVFTTSTLFSTISISPNVITGTNGGDAIIEGTARNASNSDTTGGQGCSGINVLISGGDSYGNDAGSVILQGGHANHDEVFPGKGGGISLIGMDTYEGNSFGGEITIRSGDGFGDSFGAARGGNVDIQAGNGILTGSVAGNVNIHPGVDTNGVYGNVTIDHGNVGISTTSPQATLDVNGNVGFNNNHFYYNPTTSTFALGFTGLDSMITINSSPPNLFPLANHLNTFGHYGVLTGTDSGGVMVFNDSTLYIPNTRAHGGSDWAIIAADVNAGKFYHVVNAILKSTNIEFLYGDIDLVGNNTFNDLKDTTQINDSYTNYNGNLVRTFHSQYLKDGSVGVTIIGDVDGNGNGHIATFDDANNLITFNSPTAITDGTQGAGKVFTSDVNGLGSWQTPAGFDSTICYNSGHFHAIISCSPLRIDADSVTTNHLFSSPALRVSGLSTPNSKLAVYDANGNVGAIATSALTGIAASGVTGLATVATSGSYTDLSSKPTIPSVANVATWIKIATKTFTDFSTAGATITISSGYSLPANAIIQGCYVKPTTTFSGGLISAYTISVGVGSGASIAKYAAATSVFTGVTLTTPQQLMGIESTSTTTAITFTAAATTGLLNAATAGSVDIYLLVGQLP